MIFCEVAYTHFFFNPPMKGAGHGLLCSLVMPVAVVQPGYVNGGGGQSEGAKRPTGEEGVGVPPPTVIIIIIHRIYIAPYPF